MRLLVFLSLLSITVGCGSSDRPPIGGVEGTITLDGEPLVEAGVTFVIQGARGSMGFTDDQGYYELKYLKGVMGAAVGQHRVLIDRLPRSDRKVDGLPAKYNLRTELTAEVKGGQNTIDFDLSSEAN